MHLTAPEEEDGIYSKKKVSYRLDTKYTFLSFHGSLYCQNPVDTFVFYLKKLGYRSYICALCAYYNIVVQRSMWLNTPLGYNIGV